MTRLDRHVRFAQNKLTLGRFVDRLATALLAAVAAAWVVVVVERLADVSLRGGQWWLLGALVVAMIAALVMALLDRPTAHAAAVAIDERLELKEKFSTALYARGHSDPFARAAVADAERAADSANLSRRFPIRYPRLANVMIAAAALAVLTAWVMPTFDLLGIQANHQKKAAEAAMQRNTAIANAKQALMQLEAAPSGVADADAVRLARQDLQHLLERPPADATPIQRRADAALQQMQDIQHHIAASTVSEEQLESLEAGLNPPADDKGPVADAHRELSQGKIDQAMNSLQQAVNDFQKMSPKQQQQTMQQMSNLAHQIQQQASNPSTQKNIQQQLQKMGASQQQAQQMSQLMQQAAQGNQQAAQQLQQMANQLTQQANAQGGQSQQQQQQNAQQMQQAMQQMQQQATQQSQAQQLSQSTQQLAQAMRQAAGQSGQQNGQQNSQQAGQGQPQHTPGGQQPGQGQGQGQMAQAGQQMQNALNQLKAMANGAQASAAAQQQNQPQNNPNGQPLAQARQITQHEYGSAHVGFQTRDAPDAVQHTVTPNVAPTDSDPSGRLLASSFVKDNAPLKGASTAGLSHVAESAEQDATDEVDEDRIPRSAQNAVKEYFQTLKQDGQ
jgi:hypothetical protein